MVWFLVAISTGLCSAFSFFKEAVTENESTHSSLLLKKLAETTHISFFSKAIFFAMALSTEYVGIWMKQGDSFFSAMITFKLTAYLVIENNSL